MKTNNQVNKDIIMSCSASISVYSFSPKGEIIFEVTVHDCKDSKGTFDFDYTYYDSNDVLRTITKSEYWPATVNENQFRITRDVRLSVDEAMDNVVVIEQSIDCHCLKEN